MGYAVFAGLYLAFGDRIHYLAILVVAHIIAVTNAYYAYGWFVFREGRGSYLRFHAVYLGNLGFNFVALPFLVEIVGLNPLLAQAIVIPITVIGTYLLHKRYSFGVRG